MNIAEASIRNRTIAYVATVLVVVAGIAAYERLGRLEDPEFTIKEAVVITPYPGASPAEVEEEVTNVIEKAAQQLGQLKRIKKSFSERGLSTVHVEIKDKYNKHSLPQVWDELRRKINDAQSQLPPGAGPSIVNDDFGDVYGLYYAITGDGYDLGEIRRYADFLRRELLLVQDVKRIDLYGVPEEAVYVEISREKLARLGVSREQIYSSLANRNLVADAGNVRVGSMYIPIDPTGAFESVEEMGDLLISAPLSGRMIYLRDVATIRREFVDPPRSLLRYDGNPAIGLGISTVMGGNVVTMGDAVKARLAELEPQRPVGIELNVISMQSDTVQEAVSGFVLNLLEAVAIVIIVLLVFMGLRSGLIIGAVLFITICGTFIVMNSFGIMLERISLGALIIALGMLVDNAIVVTEGMLIKIEQGEDRVKAAREVVSQQIMPLFGATLVAVTAFGAIGLSQDSTGEFCRSLFTVLLISLMLSWVTAITLTPLFCYFFLKGKPASATEEDPYRGVIYQGYRRFLLLALRFRWGTVGVALLLLAAAFYGFGYVENSFFPPSTRPQFMVDVWLPYGTRIRDTEKKVAELEDYIRQLQLDDGHEPVQDITSFVGQGALRFILTYSPERTDSSYAQLLVTVDDYRAIDELQARLQTHLDETLAEGIGLVKKFLLGPGEGGKIQIRVSGPDPARLRELSDQIRLIMWQDRDPRGRPGAVGIRSDWRERIQVVRPQLAEVQARRAGISRPDVALATESWYDGTTIGVYREFTGQKTGSLPEETRLLRIIARAPALEREDPKYINDLQIWSPLARKMIPLVQVVSGFETVWEDPIIARRNRIRTVTIHCDQRQGNASVLLERLLPKIEAIELSDDYFIELGGEYESSQNAQAGLARSLPGFLVLMVFTVICLFNALRQPAIIFLCVPLAMIGVTLGLLITRQPFGFMALLGTMSLSGMLIKNAIVLLDEIRVQQGAGVEPFAAIVTSGVSRMRPVMMAALTTVLGMLPLLLDAFFIAMAVAVMFGLTFATVLTLIVVPVLYAIFFRVPYGE